MLPFFLQINYNVRVHVIYSNWIKIIAFYRIVRRLQGYLKKQTEFKRSLQKNNWQKRISNSQKRVDLDYKSRNKLSNKMKFEGRTEVMNWLEYESSKRILQISSYCRSSCTLYKRWKCGFLLFGKIIYVWICSASPKYSKREYLCQSCQVLPARRIDLVDCCDLGNILLGDCPIVHCFVGRSYLSRTQGIWVVCYYVSRHGES